MRSERTVLVEYHAGLAVTTLNRPERLNAVDDAMTRELPETLAKLIDEDAVRAILITGAGRGFCAGSDLRTITAPAEGAAGGGDALRRHLNPMIARMMAAPKPIIAAVNGPAMGFGCALALAADIVVASRSAVFGQAFIALGAVPDAGSTWLLPRIAGDARARAMMLLGEPVPADLALSWGMIHKLVEDDDLHDAALALADTLARGPTLAMAQIKKLLLLGATASLGDQLDAEATAQDEAFATADFAEGVVAFIGKRAPHFTAS